MERYEGMCYNILKKISIKVWQHPEDIFTDEYSCYEYRKAILRHELVHAFFYECGLGDQCPFALDETLVDWIALKLPQLAELMEGLNILHKEEYFDSSPEVSVKDRESEDKTYVN